mgnify:CR=1 FL=1
MNNYIQELGQIHEKKVHEITQRGAVVQKRWLPPPSGMVKLNADGAVARSRHGGAVAAICRDHDGNYLGSSAVVYHGVTNPMMLETYACREALSLAEDLALQHIMVASDCQGVVKDIPNGT